jgi:hypothetical protein
VVTGRKENEMEPLVRGVDEEARRKNYSTIKTTPESIVRIYRLQKSSAKRGVETPYIFTPKRPRIPWHQKINWDFAINAGCAGALIAAGLYLAIWVVIPFVRVIWVY